MFKLTNVFQKSCSRSNGLVPFIRFNFASSSSPQLKKTNTESEDVSEKAENRKRLVRAPQPHKSMVAAAFASLNSEEVNSAIKTPQTDGKLSKATNIEELLSVSEGTGVSRRHALKVVSILSEWSSTGKVTISEFENDPRFIKLCHILTKSNISIKNIKTNSRSEDLSTVLSVTADDEAAKMVANITLPQMVKVMSTLSLKKRRSTLLLRSLSYNITRSTDQLNLKQCSDLLFSMATLNFLDDNLLSRVAGDITVELEKNIKRSSVIGSILTSIGLLKYKNPALLDILSEWILGNQSICRPQDVFSLLMTLAVVNYKPNNSENLFKVLLPQLTLSEAGKPQVWLDIVWSLTLLNKANSSHVSSVLDKSFLDQLEEPLSFSTKLKLLNIDGAAQYLLNNYDGPRLPSDSEVKKLDVPQAKDKTEMVTSILDTLKNLIQSDQLIRTRVNTEYGFCIDAECVLDKKCSPLPLDQAKINEDATRVAILAFDYHDMCRGKVEPTGVNNFAIRVLEAQGYKILTIPFTEFRARDKLVNRVQYIESKLKETVK
ncbi:FAST kinase domain-containing protein 4 [Diabrotica virgifera virgifera]|uniref:RAP domain-containing protein n=1 Tax=Diabrotica virgifera virgifera TaxID=50390 RepID=A0ABM5JML9_DIAVI|nr:FAST kinase domain-containing protein 4 [Diabrotica virgifera virgifera]